MKIIHKSACIGYGHSVTRVLRKEQLYKKIIKVTVGVNS